MTWDWLIKMFKYPSLQPTRTKRTKSLHRNRSHDPSPHRIVSHNNITHRRNHARKTYHSRPFSLPYTRDSSLRRVLSIFPATTNIIGTVVTHRVIVQSYISTCLVIESRKFLELHRPSKLVEPFRR